MKEIKAFFYLKKCLDHVHAHLLPFFSFFLIFSLFSSSELHAAKRPRLEKKPQVVNFAFPVDVVYTWVDDQDQEWLNSKKENAEKYFGIISNPDANSQNRFRNRDELKYSLRSVFKYAKFIRHIYIVTNGQMPSWLKKHPKITVVTHDEIFKDKSALPTFNSQAIEANIHHIPNLSEYFLYFNDDFFLGKEVSALDFFTPNGKMLIYTTHDPLPLGEKEPDESAYISACKNTNALLTLCFGTDTRSQIAHVPYGLKKSVMCSLESYFPAIFSQVSSHKFRLSTDYALTNAFVQYSALYLGQATMAKPFLSMVSIEENDEKVRLRLERLQKMRYRFFCIEDESKNSTQEIDAMLKEFFESYYPEPAPWEFDATSSSRFTREKKGSKHSQKLHSKKKAMKAK